MSKEKNTIAPFDIKDIFLVAARMKRMDQGRYPEFIGSAAFKVEFATLMDLIDKLKKQNDCNKN